PSSVGFKPRSDCWIARLTALSSVLSHGWTTISRGSGALMEPTCCSGTTWPYASTRTVSSSAGLALPLRIEASSRPVASTVFFLRSSASVTILLIILRLLHDRSDGLPACHPQQIAADANVEHDQRQTVVHAQGDRRRIHDLEPTVQDIEIVETREERRVRLLHRVGAVHAVDFGRFEDHVGPDLDRAQRRGGVGGEVRVPRPSREHDDPALLEVADGAAADVGLAHACHLDGGHDAGVDAALLE